MVHPTVNFINVLAEGESGCHLHGFDRQFGSFSLFGSVGVYRLNKSGARIEP